MQQIDELLKELQEEREDNTRLIRALDNSERYAYNCAKQAISQKVLQRLLV